MNAIYFKVFNKFFMRRLASKEEKFFQNALKQQMFDLMSSPNRYFKNALTQVNEFIFLKINLLITFFAFLGYILKHGKDQVLEQLNKFGGFPMHEGYSWDPSRLNKSKLFEEYPQLISAFFYIPFNVGLLSKTSPLQYILVDKCTLN